MPHKYSLTSMRLAKKKQSTLRKEASLDSPRYPWGLEINLNKDALQKLGKKAEDFSVGNEIYVLAKAKVTGIRLSDNVSDSSRNVDLQVTHLVIQDHASDSKDSGKKTRNTHKKY